MLYDTPRLGELSCSIEGGIEASEEESDRSCALFTMLFTC